MSVDVRSRYSIVRTPSTSRVTATSERTPYTVMSPAIARASKIETLSRVTS